MEPGDPRTIPVDYRFAVGFLLEMTQEQSLDRLVHKLVARALERPGASTVAVVIWLVEKEESNPGEGAEPDAAGPRTLYAVAGMADAAAEAPGRPSRFPNPLARIPWGVGPVGRTASTGQPCALTDLDRDPGELAGAADWFRAESVRGFLAVPLVHKGEVLGVLGSFDRINPGPEMVEFGKIVAEQITAAIVIARSFDEIRSLKARLEQHNAYLREEVVEAKAFGDLVGRSAALAQVVSQIDLVAPTDASVLILGETGTGKELVAHEIHRRSRRSERPLIRVNCAAVPRDLYESEFFGHAKGAFTGAIKDRAGRFEAADGGTLFLDEIAEVPLELQAKLLRVLQEKRYERVGEDRTRRADVRIVAATNRDLAAEAAAGRFREDLYYRLNVFPIRIAPLRQRKEDIPPLAQHFVERSVRELRCPRPRLTRAGVAGLQAYDWPGNVRELQNVIERAVILARGGVLEFDLPTADARPAPRRRPRPAGVGTDAEPDVDADAEPGFFTEAELRRLERDNLLSVLDRAHWKIKGPGGAAELLGLKPNTLLARIKAMGLERPE
jgi:transcriptional regulator with GAF, ATPase, and Fis domain